MLKTVEAETWDILQLIYICSSLYLIINMYMYVPLIPAFSYSLHPFPLPKTCPGLVLNFPLLYFSPIKWFKIATVWWKTCLKKEATFCFYGFFLCFKNFCLIYVVCNWTTSHQLTYYLFETFDIEIKMNSVFAQNYPGMWAA